MMLFLANQQELDCINSDGQILGKITFDTSNNEHVFCPADPSIKLSSEEELNIDKRLAGLNSGHFTMPTQDDD